MTTKPPDIIYLQWHGEPYYNGTIDPDTDVSEVTWCVDEIWDVDIKYLLATPERKMAARLLEALEANMHWIGTPPTDPFSYDSAREDAWKLGHDVIADIKRSA